MPRPTTLAVVVLVLVGLLLSGTGRARDTTDAPIRTEFVTLDPQAILRAASHGAALSVFSEVAGPLEFVALIPAPGLPATGMGKLRIGADGEPEVVPGTEVFTFIGAVAGEPKSEIVLAVNPVTQHVSGTISLSSMRGSLNPQAAQQRLQELTWRPRTQIPADGQSTMATIELDAPRTASTAHGLGVELMWFPDTTYKLRPGWDTAWAAALAHAHPMWDQMMTQTYPEPGIHVHSQGYLDENLDFIGGCVSHINAFRYWLRNYQAGYWLDRRHIFHLVTGDNLPIENSVGRGCAVPDAPFNTEDAVSVVEGRDSVEGDGYDPTQLDDFGLLIGQEISHVLGEEDHPDDTRCISRLIICWAETWNIMTDEQTQFDRKDFWVVDSSAERMRAHTQDDERVGYIHCPGHPSC